MASNPGNQLPTGAPTPWLAPLHFLHALPTLYSRLPFAFDRFPSAYCRLSSAHRRPPWPLPASPTATTSSSLNQHLQPLCNPPFHLKSSPSLDRRRRSASSPMTTPFSHGRLLYGLM